jgi:hypothetical protein
MQDSGAEIGRDETKQRRPLAKAIANGSRPEVATTRRYIVRMREKYFGAREELPEIAVRRRNVVAPPTDALPLLQLPNLHGL